MIAVSFEPRILIGGQGDAGTNFQGGTDIVETLVNRTGIIVIALDIQLAAPLAGDNALVCVEVTTVAGAVIAVVTLSVHVAATGDICVEAISTDALIGGANIRVVTIDVKGTAIGDVGVDTLFCNTVIKGTRILIVAVAL